MVQSIGSAAQVNPFANQVDTTGLPEGIVGAIKSASNQTGVDFSYLLKKASQESSFDPNAKAKGSSATGLYQFTQQTWLTMIKKYGDQYGLDDYASHISTDSNGIAHVKDPIWRNAILSMRKDPIVSAEMAGELDKENHATLTNNVDGKIGGTELYLAHFLGAGGASDFINEMHDNPKQIAANVLPTAAASNPSIFYDKEGSPRTLKQIYQHFAQKFDSVPSSTLIASATPAAKAPVSYSVDGMATMASAAPVLSGKVFANNSLAMATNTLKTENSSMFATMVLAQMNEAHMAGSVDGQDQKKTPFDLVKLTALG